VHFAAPSYTRSHHQGTGHYVLVLWDYLYVKGSVKELLKQLDQLSYSSLNDKASRHETCFHSRLDNLNVALPHEKYFIIAGSTALTVFIERQIQILLAHFCFMIRTQNSCS
jgi:hypothetical protein